jgi:hypothetical protein
MGRWFFAQRPQARKEGEIIVEPVETGNWREEQGEF